MILEAFNFPFDPFGEHVAYAAQVFRQALQGSENLGLLTVAELVQIAVAPKLGLRRAVDTDRGPPPTSVGRRDKNPIPLMADCLYLGEC